MENPASPAGVQRPPFQDVTEEVKTPSDLPELLPIEQPLPTETPELFQAPSPPQLISVHGLKDDNVSSIRQNIQMERSSYALSGQSTSSASSPKILNSSSASLYSCCFCSNFRQPCHSSGYFDFNAPSSSQASFLLQNNQNLQRNGHVSHCRGIYPPQRHHLPLVPSFPASVDAQANQLYQFSPRREEELRHIVRIQGPTHEACTICNRCLQFQRLAKLLETNSVIKHNAPRRAPLY